MSDVDLSDALRSQTRELHTRAERTGAMGALLRGELSMAGYARVVAALHVIYEALETELERHATHPVLGPLRLPGLARRAALANDLAVLTRLGIAPDSASPEARRYAQHLHVLGTAEPPLLAAHAWLRYLGDLNGGRILARIVSERLGVPSDAMEFYRFPALADPMAAALAWRGALNAAPTTPETRARIVQEACAGFERHIALFTELADPAQDAADASSAA